MPASSSSIAQWNALQAQGVGWDTVAKSNLAAENDLARSFGLPMSRFGGFDWSRATFQQRKARQALIASQPHRAPHGLTKTLKPLGKVIKYGAIAGVGAGLAGAAGSAFGSGAPAGGVVGSGSVSAPVVSGSGGLLGSGGGSLGSIISDVGGTVGDIWGDISSTLGSIGGIYQQGRDLFGGGGQQGPAAPPVQGPVMERGMPGWAWLVIIGGGVLLGMALLKKK
jgi:hypothetical protein